MHRTLTKSTVPRLDPVASDRRVCHEAETCIHEGDGKDLRLIERHIKAAFASLRGLSGKKVAKAPARPLGGFLQSGCRRRPPRAAVASLKASALEDFPWLSRAFRG
eukprot:2039785-Pyramimonas_sp.AAC.1